MLKDARRQREDGAGNPFAEAQRSYESEIAAQKADIKRLTVRSAFSATRRPLADAQRCLAFCFCRRTSKSLILGTVTSSCSSLRPIKISARRCSVNICEARGGTSNPAAGSRNRGRTSVVLLAGLLSPSCSINAC